MKETPIIWTEERNTIKNKVIEHLSICYNLEKTDWEICLQAIDSVFFYEDELQEDVNSEQKAIAFGDNTNPWEEDEKSEPSEVEDERNN